MKKIYTVIKQNSNIKGYWQDANGKVYIDNIKIVKCVLPISFNRVKTSLFNSGELAIFYVDGKRAIIETKDGKKDILHKRCLLEKKVITRHYIDYLLRNNNGFTVFYKPYDKKYVIEIWQ